MENRTIKWGILGTGRIAKTFATALRFAGNSELYAVGSRTKANADKFALDFNVSMSFGSYEELVQDPNIDIIYIATPHSQHLENALLAMNHNKHVLCEKPLAVNQQEVELLIEKAAEKKLFLMEALWSRFLPHIIKTKELVDSGEIGDVILMTAAFCFKSNNGPEHRHFNIDLCGGTTLDIGIYNIFLSLLLFGKPKQLSAIAGLSEQGCDNSCSYTFKYENEMLAIMHSSFVIDSPVIVEIHGSKAKISLEHRWFNPGKVRLTYADGNEQVFDFEIKGNGYEYEAIEAANCILNSKTQSDMWSLSNSLELVTVMDSIRKECGVVYPQHDL